MKKLYRIVKHTSSYGDITYTIEKRFLWIFWEDVVDHYDFLLPVAKRFFTQKAAENYIRFILDKRSKREIVG